MQTPIRTGEVAVTPRGDRGSQRPGTAALGADDPSGGHPSGRPRIATRWSRVSRVPRRVAVTPRGDRGSQPACCREGGSRRRVAVTPRGDRGSQRRVAGIAVIEAKPWRSPLGATEDRNLSCSPLCAAGVGCGGHPSGRPRIATTGYACSTRAMARWRSPLGATEDRNVIAGMTRSGKGVVAVTPRGDRGSQRYIGGAVLALAEGWRSPLGATEDRNRILCGLACQPHVAVTPRGDRGSQPQRSRAQPLRGRVAVTPRGDRGSQPRLRTGGRARLVVAVTPRGDRGSQPETGPQLRAENRVAVTPRGDRGSQPEVRHHRSSQHPGGGHPSGRPRIATPGTPSPPRSTRAWRSPLGATEDRNPVVVATGRHQPVWRSPLGATEDRNAALYALARVAGEWRSPLGPTEDRNRGYGDQAMRSCRVTVVLRGDRGSQRGVPRLVHDPRQVAVTPRGD